MDLTKDSTLLGALNLPPSTQISARQHGGSSFSSTWRLTASPPNSAEPLDFFVKTGVGDAAKVMFAGEHASLNAISDAVPAFCPRSHGHGELASAPGKYFLATDFLDLGGVGPASGESLARKLARLHTTPAPVPVGFDRPMYGFPVPTCCGDTVQENGWRESWAEFFAENRLRHVLRAGQRRNGRDVELAEAVDRTAVEVVPRLLGERRLKGVRPVVVHGDLWSGNHARGRIAGGDAVEEVVFDPSAVYGHSEYELGIMRMFGGYGEEFWREYTELVPKCEPAEEWEDRLSLYEL